MARRILMALPPVTDPNDVKITKANTSGDPVPSQGESAIDPAPENKDGQLNLEARSVKTIEHAWNICKAIEQNNRARAARTADIQAIHDGEPPRSASAKAEKGKSWQSNFSTLWLAGITGRVAQRFINASISQLSLTASRLPNAVDNAKNKSDLLQEKFTKLVRGWDGYVGLQNSIWIENVLQGYAYTLFLDPRTWKPTFIKQDRCFVPEGSGQHARDLQIIVAKMDYRLDEFLELFAWDEKSAEEVGYNIENCIYAANHATVYDPRGDATVTEYRKLADMINEGVLGLTYTSSGARVVNTYLMMNREYDGKTSFWIVHRETGKLLRFSFKLFPNMQDASALFAFEPGNGCIHSSKGLGRKLGALSIAKELFRNGVLDNARMSGMLVLQMDSKDRSRVAPAIMSPFVMLDKSITVPQQQFPTPSEGYEKVDLATDGWAEQSTGAFIATNAVYDRTDVEKTATQAKIEAQQGAETADIQIRRGLDQLANLTQIQQLRAFSDDNIAAARKIFQKYQKNPASLTSETFLSHDDFDGPLMQCLVEIMQDPLEISDEEIKIWRKSPTSIYAHAQDAAVQAGMQAVGMKYGPGTPGATSIDQQELVQRDIESMVGPELARKLVIPNIDQTVQAEAERLQIMESVAMYTSGTPIPVSPRDNHLVHGATLVTLLKEQGVPALQNFAQTPPQAQKAIELNINHLGEHLQFAIQLGQDKTPIFKQIDDFYKGFKKDLVQVTQIAAEAQVAAAAVHSKVSTEGLPPAEGAAAAPAAAAPAAAAPAPAVAA